ncbi:MAG: zf-HC2 domain-containing protein [Clostridia bacterium]|nr:zf-HC2 domain-containing protein [Clostridia bacterium]
MKLPCAVVRDLLPLYVEEMVEPETQMLIRKHLSECTACSQALSRLNSDTVPEMDTSLPLQNLKKEIQSRRWRTAAIAALLIFVAVFVYFFRSGSMIPAPWTDGLVYVEGIRELSPEQVSRETSRLMPDEGFGTDNPSGEALLLRTDSSLSAIRGTLITEDDGSSTYIIQGMVRKNRFPDIIDEYGELSISPVPDRVIYGFGEIQMLLWGEPLHGGIEVLPRLALSYYWLFACILTIISSLLWLFFRKKKAAGCLRQVCFAPLSYILAHPLLKGLNASTFFMDTDFCSILIISTALYILFTLSWQAYLEYRKDRI